MSPAAPPAASMAIVMTRRERGLLAPRHGLARISHRGFHGEAFVCLRGLGSGAPVFCC